MTRDVRNFILAGAMVAMAMLASPRRAEAFACGEEALTCGNEFGQMSYGAASMCMTICDQFNICNEVCLRTAFTCVFAGHPEWNWGGTCDLPPTW
jgi:hypothetical protein